MRTLSRVLGAGAIALTLSTTGLAFAGDTSTAETLFKAGLDAMKKSQFKEACDAFAGSNEADPSPGTQINLALCNEKQGKLASAWGWYRTAAGLADQRGQRERAELARGEATKLEPRLHKLVVAVKPPPPEGLVVTRNGAAVPNATLGAEIPVDPGDYAIEVNAKNKKPFTKTVTIAAAPGVDRVDVPTLEDAPVEAKAAAGTGVVAGSDYTKPQGGVDHTQRNVGFVVGGAGVVAGIVAVAIRMLALSEDDKAKEQSANALAIGKDQSGPLTAAQRQDQAAFQASAVDHHDAAKSNELISLITGIGAVALIGTGVALVLTAPSAPKTTAGLSRPMVVPVLGKDTAGIGLVGHF